MIIRLTIGSKSTTKPTVKKVICLIFNFWTVSIWLKKGDKIIPINTHLDSKNRLCIKVGRGQGHGDIGTHVLGLVTWGRETRDLATSSMGREDKWDGDAGHQIQGGGGCEWWGKCDISHFPREYVLVNATHPTLLTKQSLGEDPLHWRKWNCCPGLLADGILEP